MPLPTLLPVRTEFIPCALFFIASAYDAFISEIHGENAYLCANAVMLMVKHPCAHFVPLCAHVQFNLAKLA